MSHDNMGGFQKISSSELELKESIAEEFLESAKGAVRKFIDTVYYVVNEILIPFLFLAAVSRSLYAIVMFNSILEVLASSVSVLVLYYIDHIKNNSYRR